MEYQKMNNLNISDGSEAGSSYHNPPQKVLRIEGGSEVPWTEVTGTHPVSSTQKRKIIPNIIDDIDQILYPLSFAKEEFSSKNLVGNGFLRYCHHKEQFQIGNLRKEFTKELLISDNLWKAFSLGTRVEFKQSIISALRQM
eukprot:TRINITY_DN6803_c0_g1_i2.p2 TRINITY_DN6803_c0_g1~~TRINITY_DN6803_c0_g1_i2.p2  ORF type:complete len:141 (+),score=16.32 TRINITY_DN6803_c0_g1_i2:1871-2293(+)